MILEAAMLNIKEGQQADFEQAFRLVDAAAMGIVERVRQGRL